MKQSLSSNAVYKSILNICNIIIPIIVAPYVLRILNRELYDTYNSINSYFQFFLIAGAFGIYNYGVREVGRIRNDQDKCNKLFSELFIIGIITNFIVVIGYSVFALFFSKNNTEISISFLLCIQFLGNIFNVEWINEANENYLFITIKSIFVKLVYLVLNFVLVRQATDIILYVLILCLNSFLNTIFSFFYIKRKYRFVFKGLNIKQHIAPAFFMFIIANIMTLYAQFDKVFLDRTVGESSVTSYQLSQYISSMVYMVFISIITVSIPKLNIYFSNSETKNDGYALHNKVTNTYFLIMIPSSIGLALLSTEIVALYGGEKYSDCSIPLALYSIAQLVSSIHYIYGEALIYLHKNEKRLIITNIIGALVNILSSILLFAFKIYNTNYAIITIIFAYLTIGTMDIIFAKKHYKYKYHLLNKHTIIYLIAALLFIPIVIFIKKYISNTLLVLLISISVCSIEYFLFLLLFKDEYLYSVVNTLINKLIKRGKNET